MSYLGIDFGTSKVAVVVISKDEESLHSAQYPTNANLEAKENRAEQDVSRIISVASAAVRAIPQVLRDSIEAIGITGQMHGISLLSKSGIAGPLITWQDKRGSDDGFLHDVTSRIGSSKLSYGFGSYSMAWLRKYDPENLEQALAALTIHDYFGYLLTDSTQASIDTSDAASIGLYCTKSNCWEWEKIDQLGIPRALFPKVLKIGSQLGVLCARWAETLELRKGIPVAVALGDNQASLRTTLRSPSTDIAVTIGTGAQISVLCATTDIVEGRFEYRPYFNDSYIAVGAALSGGSCFNWLVDTVSDWIASVTGESPERRKIFETLDRLGSVVKHADITFDPKFAGERYDPTLRGAISGLHLPSMDLGELVCALARGVARTLKEFLPADLISSKTRLVASGNGIRSLTVMQEALSYEFGLPLEVLPAREEAATGAAMVARDL